jgi:protein required for attachment to host cells
MSKYTVVVADTVRARFFSLQDSLTPEVESSPKLLEKECLVNSEPSKSASQRRGNPTSGRTRASSGGSYAFDDHRGKRALDELRRFATLVTKAALKQTKREDAHSLVLVAEGKTLGVIRESLSSIKTNGLSILECDRDLTGENPVKIHELLARRKLVPAMKKPERRVRK